MSLKGVRFQIVKRCQLKIGFERAFSNATRSTHYDKAMERVMRRHVAVGRTREEAKIRADGNDRPNGELVWGNRDAADVLVPSYDWNPDDAVGTDHLSPSFSFTTRDINQSSRLYKRCTRGFLFTYALFAFVSGIRSESCCARCE